MGMASCCKCLSAIPVFPILAIILLAGGVVTIGAGTVNLAQIINKYDELYNTATDFSSPVYIFVVASAGLVLLIELMIAYSITSNKLRLREVHCCKNWKNFNACNGAADLDDNPNKCVGRSCLCYSYLMLALTWLNTLLALVMTTMGVAMGTLIVVGAGVCYLDLKYGVGPYTYTTSGPEILSEVYKQFQTSPFSFTMSDFNMSATWINTTLCYDPPRTAATGLAASVGAPLILLSQIMLVASFSTVYAVVRAEATKGTEKDQYAKSTGVANPAAVNIHSFVAA